MSRFLIISDGGAGCGLALRLKNEGHEASIWIRNPEASENCKGLVERATSCSCGRTVVADETGFGPLLDHYWMQDVPTVGGSSWADRLEEDRSYSEEVFHQGKIAVPISRKVTSDDDAVKIVEELGERTGKVVLKPEGKLSGVVPSYVAHDVEDAIKMLDHIKTITGKESLELVVQEFIDDGIAVSTEGWFNGKDWVEGMFNHTIERKQLMDDDQGPSGGCTGNVVWRCSPNDQLVTQLLTPLTEILREHLYRGPIDVNAIVTKDEVYGLEFTPRFGYDALPTLLHGLCRDFSFGSFLDKLARGQDCDETLNEGFAAGIRLSLPPWPSEKYSAATGTSVDGFDKDAWDYFYPYGIKDEDGELQSSDGCGILGVMNYEGDTIGQAFACVRYQINKLKIPNVQFRTDLHRQCLHDFRELYKILEGLFEEGWIGIDLDGTLAKYGGWSDEIGEPVPEMVAKVRRWIREGKEVRILTARGAAGENRHEQLMKIYEWIEDHIGEPIEVTDRKDFEMQRLYDDRVRQVVENEGVLA